MAPIQRMRTRNALFQQWEALLTNRTKRQHRREFLVQGVRPISLAVEHGWEVRAVLYDADTKLSDWATGMRNRGGATVAVASDLMRTLGGKSEGVPELLAVVGIPDDDFGRIPVASDLMVMVFDRPTSPGNVGTLIRSADAFGASGVIATGHAADVYDPQVVRASTGSLFALPVLRAASHRDVLQWVDQLRTASIPVRVVGADERAETDVAEFDLTGPTLVAVGNETTGLSAAWRDSADRLVRIPITGSASSLNAATAASIVLYEAARQRGRERRSGS